MPRRYTPTSRPTVDVRAAHWSAATDPATGRYLERAVFYTRLTYAEQQAIREEAQHSLTASGISPLDLMQAAPVFARLQGVSDPSQLDEAATRDLLDSPEVRDLLAKPGVLDALSGGGGGLGGNSHLALLTRLHELTDEGGVPFPLRDPQNGRLLPDAAAVLDELDAEDLAFLQGEVQRLESGEQQAVVPVLPQDVERAGGDPQKAMAVAAADFRQDGDRAL